MVLVKKLTKIGNSYGVILPTEIMKVSGVTPHSQLEISVKDNQIVLKPTDLKDHRLMKAFMGVLEDFDKTFKKLAK
jgi:antitoxin component of MazEF toxin-antitoxin module